MNQLARWVLAPLGFLLLSCGGGTSTSSSSSPPPSSRSPLPSSSGSSGLHVALAVQGRPDPSDRQFLTDQDGLYDSTQFTDPQLYPPGYHWKIDQLLAPRDLVSAKAIPGQGGAWELVLTFTAHGAARLEADTKTAVAAPYPADRLAVFIGPRVVQAPEVQLPSQGNQTLIGGLTEQQATAIAAELTATAPA